VFIVKIRASYSAAHRLCREDLSEEANYALYGKCSNPNGHGHNYDLEVAVAGEIDPATGMVINFCEIQQLVDSLIIDQVDHKNLNVDVAFMRGVIPTVENMARIFWDILTPRIRNGRLHHVTVGERNSNMVTYAGPSPARSKLADS